MSSFERLESNIRSYCRAFPDTFAWAKDSEMTTEDGRTFIDFFAGAGALNYGHSNEFIKRKIISYLEEDGITHSLDLHTPAKRTFLESFERLILAPRGLSYKLQFCGPTGTNGVEAALKLARLYTKRTNVFTFMGGFHGMSLGSLSVTANKYHRDAAGVPLGQATFIPYPSGGVYVEDTIAYMEALVQDTHSGVELPAAVILETLQAEGGINEAPVAWLQELRTFCDRHGILLICDEIQVGCGRTGPFFSFERAGIVPDIVVMSKSISGYGLPMAIVLLKHELDIWKPAEHNGTFRGSQLAFVGANAALELWQSGGLQQEVLAKGRFVKQFLTEHIASLDPRIDVRGMGLIWGVDLTRLGDEKLAKQVTEHCYRLGLITERAGRNDQVIKLMPPLTIRMEKLEEGCELLFQAVRETLEGAHALAPSAAAAGYS